MRLPGRIGDLHPDEIYRHAFQSGSEVVCPDREGIFHAVSPNPVLNYRQVALLQGFDALVHCFRWVANIKHQLARAGVDIAFRCHLASHRVIQGSDDIGRMHEVGKGLVWKVYIRVDHAAAQLRLSVGSAKANGKHSQPN